MLNLPMLCPNKRKWKNCLLSIIAISFIFSFWELNNNTTRNFTKKNSSLLDFENFSYLNAGYQCPQDVFLLILIHSAPNHFHHRNLIRNTWGNPGADLPTIKVIFLLAASQEFQQDIESEIKYNKDIVQGNFIDSYRNLTYKHVMGLQWASQNCSQAKYVLKMDDDIFINIYQFIHYIKSRLKYSDLKSNIACYFQNRMPVVRDPVSKWYVSIDEYAPDVFDNYCSGWAYLTTTKVAYLLHEAVCKLPYFWVDDVHVTGSAAKLANIGHIKINDLYALETDGLMDWSSSSENVQWDHVFAPTWGDLVLSRNAHNKAHYCYVSKCKCCYQRKTTPMPTIMATTAKGIAKIYPLSIRAFHK